MEGLGIVGIDFCVFQYLFVANLKDMPHFLLPAYVIKNHFSIKFPNKTSGAIITRLPVSAFSRFKTPRGQTAEQTPQPTHDERTMSCPFCAYARTSIPISQCVEQLPHEIHCPPLVVILNFDLNLCIIPRYAANGHPNLHHTLFPMSG